MRQSFRFANEADTPLISRFSRKLAAIALERRRGRLDWNRPSVQFYRSLGAVPMDEWAVYRLVGNTLDRLAKGVQNFPSNC